MSRRFQADPFDLLRQKEPFPIAVTLAGAPEPKLTIAWNSFHQNFFSELWAFLHWTRAPKGGEDAFRDCRVPRSIPGRAVLAAALWHVFLFVVPWPTLPISPKRNHTLDNTRVTWYGPVDDFPLLNVPKHAAKPVRAKTPEPEPIVETAEAYHPRQRILTDPAQPTHPRQTLVRPAAAMEAPKFLPALPNMVQLASTAGPAKPRLEISEQMLSKLRPKQVKRAATSELPSDAPNLETRPAEMSMAVIPTNLERPKLQVDAGSAPRFAEQSRKGEVVAAPDVAAGASGTAGGPSETIIALSATPAPPAPVIEVPKGNLAARVAMSPEGKPGATGSGTTASGAANAGEAGAMKNSVGISISGGSPNPNASMSGAGGAGKLSLPKMQPGYKRPDPNSDADDPPVRTGPPNFAALPPGSQPEKIFASHRVYSMNVNMPNLNSVTGSWIIRFSELRLPGVARVSGDLSGPVPVHKTDPKYPQTAIEEHIEGEVILYGVIRADGSVDSIQLVKGIDRQLDANAVAAFAQWKFEPATKGGQPVALEAIIHIPFRGPERQ